MLKRAVFVLGLLLLLLEAAGAVVGARAGLRLERTANGLATEARAGLHALSGTAASLDPATLPAARADLDRAAADAGALDAALAALRPLLGPALARPAPALEWRQGRAALAAVQDADALAATITGAAQPLLAMQGTATSDRGRALQALSQAAPAFALAGTQAADLDRELTEIRAGRLHRALAPSLGQEPQLLPLFQNGLRLAIAAPGLLGADGPRSYLVVAQDPADLRPTGGFLGSWGILTVNAGRVTGLKYQAYGAWENVRDPQREWPRQTPPVTRYYGYCCMAMQDANWFPDFPTTALALTLFAEADQPAPLSGVVAFDPALVQALLRVTGPVDLPQYQLHVTAANVVDLANYFEGRGAAPPPPNLQIGKQFLTLVAQALADRLSHNPNISLTAVATAVEPLLTDKHILIALADPAAAGAFHAFNWDGAVAAPPGDYVLLDEMSMSDNKVDGSITRRLDDQVRLRTDGSADVTLTYVVANAYPNPVDISAKTTDFRDYFRFYLPPGAQLQALDGAAEVTPPYTESGHAVAAGFVIVPRLESRTLTLRYRVPAAVVAGSGGDSAYVLHVQVQPGVAPIAFRLSVRDASGAIVADTAASLTHDQAWRYPVSAVANPPDVLPPTWDRVCAAFQLVAGLKGPYSAHALRVPPECGG